MTEPKNVYDMTREELIEDVLELRRERKELVAAAVRDSRAIDDLRRQVGRYYRASIDYVPPPESDYD